MFLKHFGIKKLKFIQMREANGCNSLIVLLKTLKIMGVLKLIGVGTKSFLYAVALVVAFIATIVMQWTMGSARFDSFGPDVSMFLGALALDGSLHFSALFSKTDQLSPRTKRWLAFVIPAVGAFPIMRWVAVTLHATLSFAAAMVVYSVAAIAVSLLFSFLVTRLYAWLEKRKAAQLAHL